MRPEGFYWVRRYGQIEPAEWTHLNGGSWRFVGQDYLSSEDVEVLAPCLMPAVGPE